MTAQLCTHVLDGRLVSSSLLAGIKRKVAGLKKKRITPRLVILFVGDNPSSLSYIRQKEKAAEYVGIEHRVKRLPASATAAQLVSSIQKLNKDERVHGILVQMPLPPHIQAPLVIRAIDPQKDVDGFQAYNLGKMFLSREFEKFVPCTPKGIIKLLDYYKISLAGKEVVIIGRSNIVGKPLAVMLINRDATVTVCHSRTRDLAFHTKRADILVAAVGRPAMVKTSMVKKGAVVIDVGITKVENDLVGDVDFPNVRRKAAWITPVPGGVGPMTVACLMENVVLAAKHNNH